MTHPERQQDPFDSELPEQTITVRHEWKNLEALERRLGEIEGRLARLEAASPMTKKLGPTRRQTMRNLTRLTEEAGGYDRETPPDSRVEEDGG